MTRRKGRITLNWKKVEVLTPINSPYCKLLSHLSVNWFGELVLMIINVSGDMASSRSQNR